MRPSSNRRSSFSSSHRPSASRSSMSHRPSASHSSLIHNRSMHPARHRSSIHIHVGHTSVGLGGYDSYSYSQGGPFLSKFLLLLGIFVMLVGVFGGILLSINIFEIKSIKNEYEYYQNAITNSTKENRATGKIVDKMEAENNKWFFVYKYNGEEFTSYAIYSEDEIDSFRMHENIVIVVLDPDDPYSDTIPWNFQAANVKDDASYITAKRGIIIGIALIAVGEGLAVLFFILSSKARKKEKLAMEDNQTNVNEFTPQTNTPKISKCRYCNSLIKDTQSVCSQCGAPLSPEDFK